MLVIRIRVARELDRIVKLRGQISRRSGRRRWHEVWRTSSSMSTLLRIEWSKENRLNLAQIDNVGVLIQRQSVIQRLEI
jgi:hypothetical protein